jgi:hypothetical protein
MEKYSLEKEIIGALARGYTHSKNDQKVLDNDLIEAMGFEVMKLLIDIPVKEDFSNDKCQCGHIRKKHGKSLSINYTEGKCLKCECKHFLMN